MPGGRPRLGLFVFIDAFGWELLRRCPFLENRLGHKAPLGTIFGYSSTCDPTILTGALPREHGHFSFYRYAPDSSPFSRMRLLSLLPKSLADRGRVRHHISKWYKKHLGYTGYFQLYSMPFDLLHYFDYTEKRDLYEAGGILGGQPTIFDHLRGRGIPFFLSDWRQNEARNLEAARTALCAGKARFAYLYLAGMDATLHRYGPGSEEGRRHVQWYDRELEALIREVEKSYGEVRLHVFSDHGMTAVTACHPLMGAVEALGLEFGRDYAAVYDSTMARFWFLTDRGRDAIVELLRGTAGGHVVTDPELRGWGCDFPNHEYGDLFFLMDPGVLLCPGHLGTSPLAGMHGYAPEHPDSVAMYASSHTPENPPGRLEDLYRIMLEEAEA
jgi:predicted AlkP superfamily pyrophosphatase or phosphodiesterase